MVAAGVDRMVNDPRRGTQSGRKAREKHGGIKKDASFDARRQVSKFAVLGRKQTRTVVNKAAAREKARSTVEMAEQQRTINNMFQDDRFGEEDEEMSVEDKMLRRFQKERATRANRFDLNDDEDDDMQLTHMGQSLGDNSFDFGGTFSDDDDDEEFFTDKAAQPPRVVPCVVNGAHFGGGDEEGRENRTRQEIMNEVIAKSKKFKAIRQKEKGEDEQMVDELDKGYKDLSSMLFKRSEDVENADWEREQAKKQWSSVGSAVKGSAPTKELEAHQKRIYADYDARVRMLDKESAKAAPTQRMKSEEEIALAETVRLKNLEEERLRRMNGEVEELERETAAPVDVNRRRTDDDLEEDWVVDGEFGNTNARLQKVISMKDEDKQDEQDEDEDEEGDEEEGGEEDEGAEDADNLDDQGRALTKRKDATKKVDELAKGYNPEEALESGQELPYTFEVPKNSAGYELLISKLSEKEEVTVIKRILVCNSVKANVANRTLMEGFVDILVQRIQSASQASPARMQVTESTVHALFALAPIMPDVVSKAFVRRITAMSAAMTESMTESIEESESQQECNWPSLGELCVLQAVASLFPVTDWRHPVVTPAILVLSRCLYYGRRQSSPQATAEDAVAGCMAATVMHSLVSPGQKFCPEVLGFLVSFLSDSSSGKGCINLQKCSKKLTPQPVCYGAEMKSQQQQLNLLATGYQLLRHYLVLYESLEAAHEICYSVQPVLDSAAPCKSLCAVHEALSEKVTSITNQPRKPLQLQPKKVAQIKMFNPRFDEDYNMDRSSDPVKERAEAKKLKKRVNRDMKHTMRELQQGSHLVSQARDKKQQQKMDIKKAKMNKHKGELEAQQHNFNHPTMGIGEKSKRNRKRKNS